MGGVKGDAVEGRGVAKTLKRGSPGDPKLYPFYPLSQLILVLFLPLSLPAPSLSASTQFPPLELFTLSLKFPSPIRLRGAGEETPA